jgi:hypothetical protein
MLPNASALMGINDYKVRMSKQTLTDLNYKNDTLIYAIEACKLYIISWCQNLYGGAYFFWEVQNSEILVFYINFQ